MILDTVFALLVDSTLCLVHSRVVCLPLLSKDVGLFVHLAFQVIAQHLQLVLELLLELIDDVVNVVHGRDGELFVFPDLLVRVIELLLHLALVLDTSVLQDLKGSTHVLHLGLERCKVLVLPVLLFNHYLKVIIFEFIWY